MLLLSGDYESDHVCDIDKYMFPIELLARAFVRCIDYTIVLKYSWKSEH